MVLRCAGVQELTQGDLDRLGFTVVDMSFIPIRDVLPHRFDLVDMRIGECGCPCLFIIESQIDSAATVQPFGSQIADPSLAKAQHPIGPARPLPVQDEITITIPLADSWFPYLGLTVTAALAPTAGNVHARAIYIQRR